MAKEEAEAGKKQFRKRGFLFNLAFGLIALLTDSAEYCTPGHRMGLGYRMFEETLNELPKDDAEDGAALQLRLPAFDLEK